MSEERTLEERIQEIIDTDINPAVASHGGSITLMGIKDNKVYVQLNGGCQGCASATATLKQGIETIILQREPEIVAVIDQTDHESGDNPFFA